MLSSAIIFRVGSEEAHSFSFMLLLAGLVFYFIALYTRMCVKYEKLKDEYVRSRISTKKNFTSGILAFLEP